MESVGAGIVPPEPNDYRHGPNGYTSMRVVPSDLAEEKLP